MKARPMTIDDYLARVTASQRVALEKLHKTIRAAAPQAEECINYGVAAFRLNGRALVGFGAGADHCSVIGDNYSFPSCCLNRVLSFVFQHPSLNGLPSMDSANAYNAIELMGIVPCHTEDYASGYARSLLA